MKITPRNRRGSFIDLKTIAAALYSRSFSLGSLADFLQTPTRKAESGGHGKQLTADYVGYLLDDVQATWECYQSLRDKYDLHALEGTPLGKVLSEASLGKAYLKHMGVRPFREVQPDFPDHLTGLIMSTYFGGRAEVRWRREVRREYQESCVRGRFSHHALTNLSSNMMANWVLASHHSRGGIFHVCATWRKSR